VAAVPAASDEKPSVSVAASPASVVLLGQDARVTEVTTYSSRGLVPVADTVYAWEQDNQEKVTTALAANVGLASTASRFQGLGAALLEQLASTNTNAISQSVIKSAADSAPNAAGVKSAQTQLHTHAQNTITLTLKTAGGATITLSLAGQDNGLALQADVTGGKLSDAERAALADLADSFQGAIDGLSAVPPRLNLGKLAQLDPSLFSSVDLNARLKLGEDQYQTLSFQADGKTKSVDMAGPSGKVQLKVNDNAAILGTAQQQAQALKSYLTQFDAAQRRGNGDKDLMTLFKDAFSALNSNAQQTAAAANARPEKVSSVPLNDMDRGVLTGLADFTASISQAEQYTNPMQPSEVDKFAFQVSQSTTIKGTSRLDRAIEQEQNSSLSASYHKTHRPGAQLTGASESQNYDYYQIEDKASSSTKLAYKNGSLSEASSTQTASQSTRIRTYMLGNLQSDITTPKEVSSTRNLLGMLEAAMKKDRETQAITGVSTLKDDLLPLHNSLMLQADPALLSR
jgi:hypothetical protein